MKNIKSNYNQENEEDLIKESYVQDMMYFHTLFGEEFSGNSPEEIVQSLYQNSKKGMGDISFENWWQYQKIMW